MKTNNIVRLGAVAACLTFTSGAFAAQPANIEEIRCSNNGKGNGGEEVTEVATGAPAGACEKFVNNPEDENGPGTNPTDPNSK